MTIYIKHHTPVNWSVVAHTEELDAYAKSNDIITDINYTLAKLAATYKTIRADIIKLEKHERCIANGTQSEISIANINSRRGILRLVNYIDSYSTVVGHNRIDFFNSLIKSRNNIIDRMTDTVRFKNDFIAGKVNGIYNIYMRIAHSALSLIHI